jgi:acid stress-induced BolA-like protein IbaG/YrbA
MSQSITLLNRLISRKLPGADIAIRLGHDGYEITVVYEDFASDARADQEAEVYEALDKAPVELVAKIASIKCRDK